MSGTETEREDEGPETDGNPLSRVRKTARRGWRLAREAGSNPAKWAQSKIAEARALDLRYTEPADSKGDLRQLDMNQP